MRSDAGRRAAARIAYAAVCLVSTAGLAEESADLDASRARWQAAGISSYEYGYHKHCECYPGTPPETVVSVTEGAITRVYHLHADSAREVPAREGSLDLYWTIDDLFALVAGAAERGAVVRARYDEISGRPTAVYVDYNPARVGDEVDVRVVRFRALTP